MGRVGTTAADARFYYHTDHLGSVTAITDEAGNVQWGNEFTPFGSAADSANKPDGGFRFASYEYDEDVELNYALSRWQDPETGRFTSVDPARDGVNWYVYCANNPLGFVDPTGLNIKVVGYTSPMGNDGKPGTIYYSTTTGQYYNNRYSAAAGEIAHIGDYLTQSHIENNDKWQRYIEERGGYLHEFHCNEIALYQMQTLGYNAGRYSQNDSIDTAAKGYKATGETTALPQIGKVGYIYFENMQGVYDHQERFERLQNGDLVIYRTTGDELPERRVIKAEDVNWENIISPYREAKKGFVCASMDDYDPKKSGYDTSGVGVAAVNTNYPDSGPLYDTFVAQQLSYYTGLPAGVDQPNLTQAQIDAEEKGESFGF